jgi:flagellar basal-body rod protein FlgB
MNRLIDAALGIHPQALAVSARRLEVLAGNMANADTPGFKARDIDFRSALQGELQAAGTRQLTTTRPGHLPGLQDGSTPEPMYRVPNHPSLDGNTVDAQMEQAAFGEAAVRYQASLDFLGRRVEGLRKALRGE